MRNELSEGRSELTDELRQFILPKINDIPNMKWNRLNYLYKQFKQICISREPVINLDGTRSYGYVYGARVFLCPKKNLFYVCPQKIDLILPHHLFLRIFVLIYTARNQEVKIENSQQQITNILILNTQISQGLYSHDVVIDPSLSNLNSLIISIRTIGGDPFQDIILQIPVPIQQK